MKSNVPALNDYFSQLIGSLRAMPVNHINLVIEILNSARDNGDSIYTMGNGGSASTASHFACDLNKGTIQKGKPRFRVVCLNDNVPVITAWANDTNYGNIFAGQVENFVKPGDIVIAISVGGNSPNVVEGIKAARTLGAYCIGFIGLAGGALKGLVDIAVIVPSENTERVEDLHLIICHAITTCLRESE